MENPASHAGSEWRQLLNEAMGEVATDKLKLKVADAEAAIFQRLQALGTSDDEEQLVLQDASALLLTLKKNVLGFADWNSRKENSAHPDGYGQRKVG